MAVTGLDESDRRKIQQSINITKSLYSERQPRRARWGGVAGGSKLRVGVLDEALDAPTSVTGTPTTADVSHHTLSSGQLSDTGDTHEITNFDPSLSGGVGALVWYMKWSGVYVPVWVGCIDVNEVQTITITGSPTGGTFPLVYQGQTATIDFDFTAAEVQSGLEGLSGIGSGNVSCTGGPLPGTPVDVEFQGTLASTNVPIMATSSDDLTGGTDPEVTVTVDTEGCCG